MFWEGKMTNTYFSLFEEKSIPHYKIFVKAVVSKYLLNFSKPHEGTFFFFCQNSLTLH